MINKNASHVFRFIISMAEDKRFLSGVVEGFYGRPWTTEQRLDLFTRMARWNLNTYLYAPKDDDKHRACWRDPYLLEEADQLSQLIRQSSDRGIEFVYAIAPGLDITFSSDREVAALKQKLNQLVSLGCHSFAILFDDIERDLCDDDAQRFPSFAHSQVALTNLMYEHLGHPKVFMFCPTEYCASRAQPSVGDSPYLKHIGESLHPDIDFMWTGPKVISKTISVASIAELTAVIRRRPLIWDNLHANDYDTRRLFLGPYSGRPSSLLPLISGVLTNPNCEYSLNNIAIHTLALWVGCRAPPSSHSLMDVQIAGGVELAKEAESVIGRELNGGVEPVRVLDQTPESASLATFEPSKMLEVALKEWIEEFHVSTRKPLYQQPTEAVTHHSSSSSATKGPSPFSLDDLRLLVDFFYLPFQHGIMACTLLEEFVWLKENAPGYDTKQMYRDHADRGNRGKVGQWLERAKQFRVLCTAVSNMYVRLTTIPNRLILYDLYHYVWDAKEMTSLLNSYLSWLEAGGSEVSPEREPYVRQGGIVADMQRLLPQMSSCEELFSHHTAPPHSPSPHIYTIRPYTLDDKGSVYETCLKTASCGDDATTLYPSNPELPGDRFVGPYCVLSSELSFVLEDSEGVCGYVLGVLDSQRFYERIKKEWLPLMCSKYPPAGSKAMNRTEQDMLKQVMNPESCLLPSLHKDYPSHVRIDLMKRAQGPGVCTRMINTILSTLKARGSCGVYLELNSCSKKDVQLYIKLGFTVLDLSNEALGRDPPPNAMVLVRRL